MNHNPTATFEAPVPFDKKLLMRLYAWRAAKAAYGFVDCVALWTMLYSDFAPWSLWLVGGLTGVGIVFFFWPTPRWVRDLRVVAIQRRKQKELAKL